MQQENLNKKLELIKLAESLKDSEDWTSATDMFKKFNPIGKKLVMFPENFQMISGKGLKQRVITILTDTTSKKCTKPRTAGGC